MEPGSTGSAAGGYNMTFLEDGHDPACRGHGQPIQSEGLKRFPSLECCPVFMIGLFQGIPDNSVGNPDSCVDPLLACESFDLCRSSCFLFFISNTCSTTPICEPVLASFVSRARALTWPLGSLHRGPSA